MYLVPCAAATVFGAFISMPLLTELPEGPRAGQCVFGDMVDSLMKPN